MPRRLVVILGVFCILRFVLSFGPAIRYPDSPSYEHLGLHGLRLWVVPLAYSIVRPDRLRVLAQIVAGVVAWAFAATSLASALTHRWTQTAALIAVTAVGLTPQVTQWDSLILSESAAISLLAIAFGVVVRYAVRPSAWLAASVVGSLGLWAFTRHINLLLVLIAAPAALVVALLRRSRRGMCVSGGLLSLGLIGLLGLAGARAVWHDNANAILTNRILASREATRYFVHAGLPGPTPDMLAWVGRFSSNAPQLQDAVLQSWIGSRWSETYGRYLASHPREAMAEPLWRFPKLWASELHYRTRRTRSADRASHFSLTEGAILLALTVAAGALALVRRRRHEGDTRDVVVGVGLCSAVVGSFLTWHLSATELARLMLPWALVIRLMLVLYILIAIDAMLVRVEGERPRRGPRPVETEPCAGGALVRR